MKINSLLLIVALVLSAVFPFPAAAHGDLGKLTTPIQNLCIRALTSPKILLDNPVGVKFDVEKALKLSKEIQKKSPDFAQVIEGLVALTPPPSRGTRIAKRAIDITVASIGLLATAPLYPIIATAFKLDSPGPVFYLQERSGKLSENTSGDLATDISQSTFKMYKFRSMRVDAEAKTGAVIASKDDPRVTRVGKFLRKSRLDEIPQFINVLKGDMSVVGPRPERGDILLKMTVAVPYFAERMRNVKPGITGLAQVSLSYSGGALDSTPSSTSSEPLTKEQQLAADFQSKLLYDMIYKSSMRNVGSFLVTELWIIVKTPLTMIRGTGR